MALDFNEERNYEDLPNTLRKKVEDYAVIDAYKIMPAIYACINARANALSSVPLLFYTKDTNKQTEMRRHNRFITKAISQSENIKIIDDQESKIYKLFNPPKQFIINTIAELMQTTEIAMGVMGECFWDLKIE